MKILAIAQQFDRCEASMISILTKDYGVSFTLIGEANQRYKKYLPSDIEFIPFSFKSRFDLKSIIFLRKILKDKKIDLIHYFSARGLSNGLIASFGLSTKQIAYRGTMGHLSKLDPSSWLSFLNPKLNKIVCVSNAVAQYLLTKGVPKDRVETIHKGHNVAWYATTDKNSVTRAEFNITPDKIIISCVANIRPVKGVDILITAFNILPENHSCKLLLIGEIRGDYIQKLINSSIYKNDIITTGFRADAVEVVAISDIFVMPSVAREGLPKALIEAMSKKVAPIVSNVGGMPEVVSHNQHGLVVEPKDPKSLAEAILKLAGDNDLRKQFALSSYQQITENFNIIDTCRKTLKLYKKITNS